MHGFLSHVSTNFLAAARGILVSFHYISGQDFEHTVTFKGHKMEAVGILGISQVLYRIIKFLSV